MTQETYQRHQSSCLFLQPTLVKMPKAEKMGLTFKHLAARWFTPVVFRFDLQSPLQQVTGSINVSQISSVTNSSTKWLLHLRNRAWKTRTVIGVNGEIAVLYVEIRRSFSDGSLGSECRKQSKRYCRDIVPGKSLEPQFRWICEDHFGLSRDVEDDKVVDHCQYSGQFLGLAHPECNLKRRTFIFIAVIAHNLPCYDLHHACLYIHIFKPDCKIDFSLNWWKVYHPINRRAHKNEQRQKWNNQNSLRISAICRLLSLLSTSWQVVCPMISLNYCIIPFPVKQKQTTHILTWRCLTTLRK